MWTTQQEGFELRPTESSMPRNEPKPRRRKATGVPTLALGAGLCAWSLAGAQGLGGQQTSSVLSTAPTVRPADAAKAEEAYLAGARLIEQKNLAGAQEAFAKAARLDPQRPNYEMAFTLTRAHRINELVQSAAKARMSNDPAQADRLLAEARTIDPKNEEILEHTIGGPDGLHSAAPKATFLASHDPVYAPPIEVKPAPGLKDVDLRGDAKTVIRETAQAFGLKVVFDASTDEDPRVQMHFNMAASPYDRTMPLLLKMSHMFAISLDAKTLLVAKESQENRARLVRLLEETIYVPGSTTEELNELTNIVKNVFDVKQVAIAASSGTLILRAPETTLSALNETLDDLLEGASEVMIEVKLISVNNTSTVNTGLQTPTSINAFNVYSEAASIVSANSTLVNTLISSGAYTPTGVAFKDVISEALLLLLSGAVTDAKLTGLFALFGNGTAGLTGLTLGGGATFNFGINQSDTKALDDVTVRVDDHQTAVLKIGEKYPITTATYSSGVSSATSSALAGVTINGVSASTLLNQYLGSNSAATIPQVQYEDLGLTLKATPSVLRSGMVDMKIELKVEALEGGSLNGIPILTSEVFSSDLTTPDGTTAIMLSDLSSTQAASISGLPGLGDLPGFKESAADSLRDQSRSELILLITPHVVRHRKDLIASRRIPFESTVPAEC
jgi:general secretion pathway protein D